MKPPFHGPTKLARETSSFGPQLYCFPIRQSSSLAKPNGHAEIVNLYLRRRTQVCFGGKGPRTRPEPDPARPGSALNVNPARPGSSRVLLKDAPGPARVIPGAAEERTRPGPGRPGSMTKTAGPGPARPCSWPWLYFSTKPALYSASAFRINPDEQGRSH